MSNQEVGGPPESRPRVGVIGLGIMGKPMAHNLIRAAFPVTVFNRSPGPMAELVQAGAQSAPHASAVTQASDIVISIVPDSPDAEAVARGPDGLFQGVHPGLIWIDMSSISPITARELAAEGATLGVQCLDAPVSGGEQGAIDGTLSIMVGGPEEVFERCLPVLDCLGRSIVHMGSSGAGQVTKVCNQIVVGATIAAVAETLVLGAKAGVDPARIREVLLGGFAQSRILDVHGQRMLSGAFEPGFRIALHQKDLAIATDLARGVGVAVPMAAATAQFMNAAAARGDGQQDHAALVRVFEGLAEVSISDRIEADA